MVGVVENCPVWHAFSAEETTVEILMCIQKDKDVILCTQINDFLDFLKISEVVLLSNRFKSFPRHHQSDGVESPFYKILSIFFNKRIGGIEDLKLWIERECLDYNILAMEQSSSVEFIDEMKSFCVDFNRIFSIAPRKHESKEHKRECFY